MKIEDIIKDYEDFSEDVSKDVYVRNSHYHMTDNKRDFSNISYEGKLGVIREGIKLLEVQLLKEKGFDNEYISLCLMLDDKEEIKVDEGDNEERIESLIYYLNVYNGILEEILENEN